MADPGVTGATMPEDRELRALIGDARTIAVVGLSSNPDRPSNSVAAYLQAHGYTIVPVNPHETEVLGERAFASLLDIPSDAHVDVVDVFRVSDRLGCRPRGDHGRLHPQHDQAARRSRELGEDPTCRSGNTSWRRSSSTIPARS